MPYTTDPLIQAMKPVFRQSRAYALKRGIPWRLSFEEFAEFWRAHWMRRHPTRYGLILCRLACRGPFEMGNVYIGSRSAYTRERHRIEKRAREKMLIESA